MGSSAHFPLITDHPEAPVYLGAGSWSLRILPPWERWAVQVILNINYFANWKEMLCNQNKKYFLKLCLRVSYFEKCSKLVSHLFLWKAESKLHIWSLSEDLFNFREGHYKNCYRGCKWGLSVHLRPKTTMFSILDWLNLGF